MIARGDRKHDIAAWFGLNQGRIAEVEDGEHGPPIVAPPEQLPPSGSPGPKALALRSALEQISSLLEADDTAGAQRLIARAIKQFEKKQ
jgi:hypothetical protein